MSKDWMIASNLLLPLEFIRTLIKLDDEYFNDRMKEIMSGECGLLTTMLLERYVTFL
jgi:hypothetical protein